MSNYNSLKTTIDANIKQNGRQEITGQILNSVLNQMVNILGTGYQFAGVATTATNPGTPDAKVFYIANGKGTYTNFGGLEVTENEVVVLYWDTAWHKESTGIASQAKLTELGKKIDNFEPGFWLNSLGNKNVDADYCISLKIKVSEGQRIRVHTGRDEVLYTAYYDANNNFIDSLGIRIDRSYNAPATTAYIKCTFWLGNINDCYVLVDGYVAWKPFIYSEYLYDRLKELSDTTKKSNESHSSTIVLNSFEGNTFINANGVIVHSDGVDAVLSNSIPVIPGDIVFVNTGVSDVGYMNIYGISDNIIATYGISQDRTITIPENATRIQCTFPLFGVEKCYIKNNDNIVWLPYVCNRKLLSDIYGGTQVLNRYGLGVDGNFNSSEEECHTDFIPVKGGKRIIWFTNTRITDGYIYEYDQYKQVITYWGCTDTGRAFRCDANTRFIRATFMEQNLKECYILEDGQYVFKGEIDGLKKDVNTLKSDEYIIPEYYKAHLAEKEQQIIDRNAKIGKNGDNFIFITDMHIEVNYMHSPALMKHIIDNTPIKMVVNGGDVMNGGKTWEEGVKFINDWYSATHFTPQFITLGNHDVNSGNGAPSTDYFTDGNAYALFIRPIEQFIDTEKKNYYYLDNKSQKIRYFFLDLHWPTEVDYRGEHLNWTTQLNWMEAKTRELDSSWSIMVFAHCLYQSQTMDGKVVTSATLGILGTELVNKLNNIIDGNNAPTVIGIMGGHNHFDWVDYTAKGYPIISTMNDSSWGMIDNAPLAWFEDREFGTINEQAFDVVQIDTNAKKIYCTRVGYGSDREFSYTNTVNP